MTKAHIPELRFKDFNSNWEDTRLIDMAKNGLSNGVFNDKSKQGIGYKLINVKDMYIGNKIDVSTLTLLNIPEREFKKNKVLKGDIFFTRSSIVPEGIAHSNIFLDENDDVTFDGHLMKMSPNESIVDSQFLFYVLQTRESRKKFIRRGKISTMTTIGQDDIAPIPFKIPSLQEQEKIADFLSSVDKKISLLKEKHALLEQYKKGAMQKLFKQEIRFKGDNGSEFPDWQELPLSELSRKVSGKNKDESVTQVLTNSAKDGIVNQGDYFNKDIANQGNLGGYTIVEKGDFVYNPRISELAPVGPIKRNHKGQGVMSPLYTVFRFKDKSLLDFVEQYFNTTMWHRYMHSIANFGARHDRMNITTSDFYALPVPLPCQKEREKIVAFIEALNSKCDSVKSQLELTQTFKKGLLQQMFV